MLDAVELVERCGDVMTDHKKYMRLAIAEAIKASELDEVPIGAVAVIDDEIIAAAHNVREVTHNPLGHAEILLIEKLVKPPLPIGERVGVRGSWRLENITFYVTCEPCIMCMGALLQARIPKVVFGCFDPKAGACGSLYNLSNDSRLNHRIEVVSGVLAEECGELLKKFFKKLR